MDHTELHILSHKYLAGTIDDDELLRLYELLEDQPEAMAELRKKKSASLQRKLLDIELEYDGFIDSKRDKAKFEFPHLAAAGMDETEPEEEDTIEPNRDESEESNDSSDE